FASLGLLGWIVSTRPIGQIDAMLAVAILLGFSMSMLFLCIYILGAYLSRMYIETKQRPIYITMEHAPGTAMTHSAVRTPGQPAWNMSMRPELGPRIDIQVP